MLNVIDLILIIVVALFIFLGVKKGFTGTLLSFIAKIVSFIAAYIISDMYAATIYEKYFKESVVNRIDSHVFSGEPGEDLRAAFDSLPQKISAIAESFGIDVSALHGSVDGIELTGDISSSVEAAVAGPIGVAVCRIVIFCIASIVFSLLLGIVVNLVCKIVKLPVLRTADKILGALLGAFNGLLLVFIFTFICVIVSGLVDNTKVTEAVDSSYIIDFFAYTGMLI